MRERPILFSGEMVRAILAGRKTQTRRIAKKTASGHLREVGGHRRWHPADPEAVLASPYGQPGERLWVRETWGHRASSWNTGTPEVEIHLLHYRADDARERSFQRNGFSESPDCKLPKPRAKRANETRQAYNDYLVGFWRQWRPAIFMQRWMSRIMLEVTAVRVERLQDISEDDAVAEGVDIGHPPHEADQPLPSMLYQRLWEQINGPGSWAANPWVWVIEFKRSKP